MSVALLTCVDLRARLDVSREAARRLAGRRSLPRARSDDGKALLSVDVREIRSTPRPRMGRLADHVGAAMAGIEAFTRTFLHPRLAGAIARTQWLASPISAR
jgi:hypothetical protein